MDLRETSTPARIIYVVCLAVALCYISNGLGGRFLHLQESANNQLLILAGRPTMFDGKEQYFGAWQNRVLFPLGLKVLSDFGGLSTTQWFVLLRIATAVLGLAFFAYALNAVRPVGWRTEAAGLGVISLTMLMTFAEPWEVPGDFLDLGFVSLFLWATARSNRWALLLLALVAAANRESAAFAGILWAAKHGFISLRQIRYAEIAFGALVCALVLLHVAALRYGFGGDRGIGSETQTIVGFLAVKSALAKFLADPSPFSWPFLLLIATVPSILWLVLNRQFITSVDARMLTAAAMIFVGSLAFAHVNEIRPFLPAFVVLTYVAATCDARIPCRDYKNAPRPD